MHRMPYVAGLFPQKGHRVQRSFANKKKTIRCFYEPSSVEKDACNVLFVREIQSGEDLKVQVAGLFPQKSHFFYNDHLQKIKVSW